MQCTSASALFVQHSSAWQDVFIVCLPQCTPEVDGHLLTMAFCSLLQVSVSVYSFIHISCLLLQSLVLLQQCAQTITRFRAM